MCWRAIRINGGVVSITARWSRVIDHYLDDRLSLSLVSPRQRRRRRSRVGAVNNIRCWMARPRISGQLYRKSPKLRRRQIVQKHVAPPPSKDISTKSWESTYGQSSTIVQVFTPKISDHKQKIHIFSLYGTPLGDTVPRYTFLESSRRSDFNMQRFDLWFSR